MGSLDSRTCRSRTSPSIRYRPRTRAPTSHAAGTMSSIRRDRDPPIDSIAIATPLTAVPPVAAAPAQASGSHGTAMASTTTARQKASRARGFDSRHTRAASADAPTTMAICAA